MSYVHDYISYPVAYQASSASGQPRGQHNKINFILNIMSVFYLRLYYILEL